MKAYIILWFVVLLALAPIALNIQHLFVYSDSPFLTNQYDSVKVKNVLIKYFNYSSEDEIYVLIQGNYSSGSHLINITASKYLQNFKLLTPYDILNQSNNTYFKTVRPLIEKVYNQILPLHNVYQNLTLQREIILSNITNFQYQLNITYGVPLGKVQSNSPTVDKFVEIYTHLNGSTLEKARNASLLLFKDPFILMFSFNNYTNASLILSMLSNFSPSDYVYLVHEITGKNITFDEIKDPFNYSVSLIEKEFPPQPISINQFHKGDEWLFIIQVPSNESLTNVENFMNNLNATVTGHLPIYAESAVVTEQDIKTIDVVTVAILAVLLIVLIRSVLPIILLILSAVIGLVIAYSLLYTMTFFGYSIYYISGLVIPPIVFGITVDYSILFLYRYFEEARKGTQNPLNKAFRTAGKAVVLSGLSISLGFSSFIISSSPLLRNIGIALVIASVSSLIPALLFMRSMLGSIDIKKLSFPRKEVPNPVDVRQKYLERISRFAINKKYFILVVMLVLGIGAFYVFTTHTTNVSIREIVPSSSNVVVGEEELAHFYNYSIDYIIIQGNPNASYLKIYNLTQKLINEGSLVYGPASIGKTIFKNSTYITNLYYSHNYSLLEVYIPYPVFSKGAINFTSQLINQGYLVGGSNAERVDIVDNTVHLYYIEVLPLTIAIITVYLIITLGSIIVPLRLSLTLLLSSLVGVAILYLIYGNLYWLTPLIVFAIMYSLGIDYDMFIIIRILEEKGSEEDRIVNAVKNTGLVVTAAGLILAGAFLSLGSSDMRFLQEIGIGVGITILFDTFIVRPIFVPAILAILKKYNWWPKVMNLTRDDG